MEAEQDADNVADAHMGFLPHTFHLPSRLMRLFEVQAKREALTTDQLLLKVIDGYLHEYSGRVRRRPSTR